jgi:hypothetical protein
MKKLTMLALLSSVAILSAFANSNAGSKVFVCPVPQNNDLAKADYELLTWTEIKSFGNMDEIGSNTNILTYDTWDKQVVEKSKGLTDAGSPTIEVARLPFDAGQNILRAAALTTNQNYAFKIVRNDPINTGGVPTIIYNRGLVTGPSRPMGRNEDMDLEVYTFAFNQIEIVVNPLAGGVAPTNTVIPAITGTATVGQVLTVSNGTFTGDAVITFERQWFAGGVAILGATGATFTLTSAQIGKIIQARVTGTNASGSANAFSNATAVVA